MRAIGSTATKVQSRWCVHVRKTSRLVGPRRTFAVYAVGEGWTGALGTGRLDERIVGHFDEDERNFSTANGNSLPVCMYEGPVRSLSVGWGHTALVTSDDHRFLVTGRPHDFSNLMRLRRLPAWLRDSASREMLRSSQNGVVLYSDLWNPMSLLARLLTWLSERADPESAEQWDRAREHSIMTRLTEVKLPGRERPISVACSAGISACLAESGCLYMFGLNGFGQCGIGVSSNNVWEPSKVTGLTFDAELEQSHSIQSVALGLQHALCLNEIGQMFSWGKGERGQLGQEIIVEDAHTAKPIRKSFTLNGARPIYAAMDEVKQIASGMLHSAALTTDNQVFLWGKNILPILPGEEEGRVASDCRAPFALPGLPANQKVIQIACGSHHTSMLLEDGSVWAVGVSSDTREPIHEPVLLIPRGMIELPVRQFAAHMDRTTVVGASGRQVLQANLWKDPENQEYAVFTPAWIDHWLDHDSAITIRQLHRSWIHSVALTD